MAEDDEIVAGSWTVALPETRQLDLLAQLLERRGMQVVRCPMVAIEDTPDQAAVVAWIGRFIDQPMRLLIIYTGEGIYRLRAAAGRAGLEDRLIAALESTPLLTRGPKPKRALRELGIKPELEAAAPTTSGVIETLGTLDLDGGRLGVQLYGADPNEPLMEYLRSRGIEPDCVAPYVYASESDDAAVGALIGQIGRGEIDAIAFTSKAQVERMEKVAGRQGLAGDLHAALGSLVVAAVGPVVGQELKEHGVRVDVMPERDFFMKPLVTGLVKRLQAGA